QRVGQCLRDDREIHARDARAEREPAEHESEQPRNGEHHEHREPEHVEAVPVPRQLLPVQEHHEVGQLGMAVYAARADLAHQVHAHRVAAEREERAVTEAQYAGVAPDQIERDREQRIAEILAEQRHRERRHVERRALRHGEVRLGAAVVTEQSCGQHHASAARPFCGKSPRGRFWMNTIRNRSTRIFATTAPTAGSSSLLTTPSERPLTSVPQRLPTPPNTTTMKESTMYACPRFGPTFVSCDSATPATPAMPAPRPNVSASIRAVLMPIVFAIARFCVTARISRPSRVRFRTSKSSANTSRLKTRM